MTRMTMALAALTILGASTGAESGWFSKKDRVEEVPGAHPELIAPNGAVVPPAVARQMQKAPEPLFGKGWARRPWAMPAARADTPSGRLKDADLIGWGYGSIPGYSNDAYTLGNYPTASVGPGNPPLRTRPYKPMKFPFLTGITGH